MHAEEIGCISITFRFLGANDKVCVKAFDDPQIPGVSCHTAAKPVRAASRGRWGSRKTLRDSLLRAVKLAPSSCRRSSRTKRRCLARIPPILFKETQVHRLYDQPNTLMYMAISTKIIEGSPMSSISTVPIMRWNNEGEPRVSRTNPGDPHEIIAPSTVV